MSNNTSFINKPFTKLKVKDFIKELELLPQDANLCICGNNSGFINYFNNFDKDSSISIDVSILTEDDIISNMDYINYLYSKPKENIKNNKSNIEIGCPFD